MGKKTTATADRARLLLAQEAARILVAQGSRDYHAAKIKAAEKLGMTQCGSLPGNQEIEQAISENLQLFGGETHANFLATARVAALSAMEMLAEFEPRLVGAVLNGTADPSSTVGLHVFSDSPEMVAMRLTDLNVSYRAYERRVKSRLGQVDAFPGFAFVHDSATIEATVFPFDGIRQAPISPINGKPMQRASIDAVRDLINQL
jgi:hypothetical protein